MVTDYNQFHKDSKISQITPRACEIIYVTFCVANFPKRKQNTLSICRQAINQIEINRVNRIDHARNENDALNQTGVTNQPITNL